MVCVRRARWDHLTAVEIVNATVLHHLSLRDERVEKVALTSDVKTRDQFATEMNAFHKKRLASSSRSPSADPEVKRRKLPDPRIKCHYCGVPGHKIAECRTRTKTERQEATRRPERSRPAVSSKVSCFKCREEGHIAPNCPLLRKTNRDSDNERRVNSRVVG
jgi:ribosomal protein L34E